MFGAARSLKNTSPFLCGFPHLCQRSCAAVFQTAARKSAMQHRERLASSPAGLIFFSHLHQRSNTQKVHHRRNPSALRKQACEHSAYKDLRKVWSLWGSLLETGQWNPGNHCSLGKSVYSAASWNMVVGGFWQCEIGKLLWWPLVCIENTSLSANTCKLLKKWDWKC